MHGVASCCVAAGAATAKIDSFIVPRLFQNVKSCPQHFSRPLPFFSENSRFSKKVVDIRETQCYNTGAVSDDRKK
jgi:hypothetical protein